MEIGPKTKVDDLLNLYPFLMDYLLQQSPKFKNLQNPVMRRTVGKVATLSHAASIGGLDLDKFIEGIKQEIQARAGQETAAGEACGPVAALSPEQRQEALKGIIRDLHAGADREALKLRFRQLIRDVEAGEVARMEQALIQEGLPAEEIQHLCSVHVEIFKEALEGHEAPTVPAGHPVHTFMKENRACERVLDGIEAVLVGLGSPPDAGLLTAQAGALAASLAELAKIDLHYARKENQLFPLLEAQHFTGPSQVMWAIDDDIRAQIKKTRQALDQGQAAEALAGLQDLITAVRDMIYKEEHILFPASLEMLGEAEWVKVKQGEEEIGFAWVEPDPGWPAQAVPALALAPADAHGAQDLELDTGRLTPQQVNLLLNHLPLDLTFVDALDRVAYYSKGPERIFPRSPAIIGRKVQNCHPPKSIHIVNQILEAFRAGTRDSAAFWIELGGKFIYIRYFAVRDAQGRYQGTLEVSQEVTEIRGLKGQNRLLDWS